MTNKRTKWAASILLVIFAFSACGQAGSTSNSASVAYSSSVSSSTSIATDDANQKEGYDISEVDLDKVNEKIKGTPIQFSAEHLKPTGNFFSIRDKIAIRVDYAGYQDSTADFVKNGFTVPDWGSETGEFTENGELNEDSTCLMLKIAVKNLTKDPINFTVGNMRVFAFPKNDDAEEDVVSSTHGYRDDITAEQKEDIDAISYVFLDPGETYEFTLGYFMPKKYKELTPKYLYIPEIMFSYFLEKVVQDAESDIVASEITDWFVKLS